MDYYQLLSSLFSQNQVILGIFITAGLSFLLYMYLLRLNNFFDYSKQYDNKIKAFAVLQKIYPNQAEREFYYTNSNKPVSDDEALMVADFFNLFIQIGILYRMGLIDRKLVFLHFGMVLTTLDTQYRQFIDFAEANSQGKDITYLINQYQKWWNRKARLNIWKNKVKNLFKGR